MKINLKALSIGPDIPCDFFIVRPHSIFRKAIYLEILSAKPQEYIGYKKNQLITILSRNTLDQPQSIRLNSIVNFIEYNIDCSRCGTLMQHSLFLYRKNIIIPIYIDLKDANYIKRKKSPIIGCLNSSWYEGIKILTKLQIKFNSDIRIENLITKTNSYHNNINKKITETILTIGQLVKNHRTDILSQSIAQLIGFGTGLTPSGDDFLCGFIASANCKPNINHDYLSLFKSETSNLLIKTNIISSTFLQCAMHKDTFGILHDLANSISKNTCCNNDLYKLCTFGHSSGMDIATGFMYGLTIWN